MIQSYCSHFIYAWNYRIFLQKFSSVFCAFTSRNFYAEDTFLYIVTTWSLREISSETRKSKRQQRVVATEMTRGQHSTFGRLTYPTSSFLRSQRASSSSPSTYIFPRERESFALIAPRAQGDEVTALFVCHSPATCLALASNVRVREGKRQRATERNGAKTRCTIVLWKVSSA